MRRKLFSIISLVLFFAVPFSAWGAGGASALLEAVSYNHLSWEDRSILGAGWELGGVEYIERSTRSGRENLYSNSEFTVHSSLGFGRLLLDSGRSYGLEVESQKVEWTFVDGQYWRAEDLLGRVFIFGSMNESRLSDSRGTKVFAWYLESMTDLNRNTITYHYIKDSGAVYLSSIEYGGNMDVPVLNFNRVRLEYENRPDPWESYASGFLVENKKILKNIVIENLASGVWNKEREYLLAYSRGDN
ncbi:MAG: YD repeat-/RHS repeat-containing protein, partial [Parcubacteria group bacterium Gr01-1014_18]